ncbi:hypothetical protein NKH18_26810 [Streptomyces sp. M10(2022)]
MWPPPHWPRHSCSPRPRTRVRVTPRPAKDAAELSRKLVKSSSAKDAYRHLKRFQEIAESAGGHRAAGSLGYDASAAYVYRQLQKAGYEVDYQDFGFVYTQPLAEKLSVVSPAPATSPSRR